MSGIRLVPTMCQVPVLFNSQNHPRWAHVGSEKLLNYIIFHGEMGIRTQERMISQPILSPLWHAGFCETGFFL